MAYFAIYNNADGGLDAIETDAASQRLTDQQLTARGKTRVSVNGPLGLDEQWNPVTHQKEPRVKTQAQKDQEASRARLKTLAAKGGKNLTQQDRDELLCLRTLLELGEL